MNERKKKAYWVAERCWSQADALLKFNAYLDHDWAGSPDVRSKAKESFSTLWKACVESEKLYDEKLADLFRRARYEAELKKKPFRLRYPLSDSVKEALMNLFHVDNHILKTGRGEQLPDRALAGVLVEHFRHRDVTSLLFIGCGATGGPWVKEGPAVGICTVIPMRTVK